MKNLTDFRKTVETGEELHLGTKPGGKKWSCSSHNICDLSLDC